MCMHYSNIIINAVYYLCTLCGLSAFYYHSAFVYRLAHKFIFNGDRRLHHRQRRGPRSCISSLHYILLLVISRADMEIDGKTYATKDDSAILYQYGRQPLQRLGARRHYFVHDQQLIWVKSRV